MNLSRIIFLFCSAVLLSACNPFAMPEKPVLTLSPLSDKNLHKSEDAQLVQQGNGLLLTSDQSGLTILDAGQNLLRRAPGQFSGLDHRLSAKHLIAATYDAQQRAQIVSFSGADFAETNQLILPANPFEITGLCLYQDPQQLLHVFLLGESGQARQWLVAREGQLLPEARMVRDLAIPPHAEYCAVDDGTATLFVNEEQLGLWALNADPESDNERQIVDLVAPYGNIAGNSAGIAVAAGQVFNLDTQTQSLNHYQRAGETWQLVQQYPLTALQEAERISVTLAEGHLDILIQDDGKGLFYRGQLPFTASTDTSTPLPEIPALGETQAIGQAGDAADDPAIWVNPHNPAQSRILGTNKKAGLHVYDLQGQELQRLPVGRINNVDLRQNVMFTKQSLDMAVASNRDHNSLSLFSIDRDGSVQHRGEIQTSLRDIYGLCLYQPQPDALHVIVNDKDGEVQQLQIVQQGEDFTARAVARWKLNSQPEGCVADDTAQRLFIGEEDEGIWTINLRRSDSQPEQVMQAGGPLVADVEGMALYQRDGLNLLLVSSQGNNSYLMLDATPPYALRGAFRIGINAELGIDGVSETDGLDISNANLGGPWQEGLLVVQDGRNRLPDDSQNFKLIPASALRDLLRQP